MNNGGKTDRETKKEKYFLILKYIYYKLDIQFQHFH